MYLYRNGVDSHIRQMWQTLSSSLLYILIYVLDKTNISTPTYIHLLPVTLVKSFKINDH